MARDKVKIGRFNNTYYSIATGLPLRVSPFRKKDGLLKDNYNPDIKELTAENITKLQAIAKAKRNAYAKERAPGVAARRKEQYRDDLDTIWDAQMIAPYRSGKERVIGSSRDSYITAVNNTIATITGIPLNKHNREVIGEIYGREMQSAMTEGAKDFAAYKQSGKFDKVKNVRLYKTADMAPPRIIKPEARAAWAARYSYGGKSVPALNKKVLLYGRTNTRNYPDIVNIYAPPQ